MCRGGVVKIVLPQQKFFVRGLIWYLPRVTIFGKAKIGTMDGDFSRDQIYGLFKFFFNKSGTLKCSSRLDCWVTGSGSKR